MTRDTKGTKDTKSIPIPFQFPWGMYFGVIGVIGAKKRR